MTREELIAGVQELAKKLGRTPRFHECTEAMRGFEYSLRRPENGFDRSLKKLLDAANLHSAFRGSLAEAASHPQVQHPLIPDPDLTAQQIIDMRIKQYEQRKAWSDAKKWMEFAVNTDLPIGICHFGDPHLDDDGCDWPLLQRDIALCRDTPGLFGMNMGDVHNNWVGRLMKEYANQSTTRSQAWKLIDWFFKDSGVKWLVMLLGNHDEWNYGNELLTRIAENTCTMIDWRAQFVLRFSNDCRFRIDAAHDHSGQSQWNSLHAQQKASSMGGTAHLYIAGHRHNWAVAQHECPHTNRVYWLARARGYKRIDDYAEKLGFGEQKFGASIVTVIDPKASEVNRARVFADVAEGAEYLTFLRSRRK